MSTVADLSALLPPPITTLEVPSADDFARCERSLTKLPDDYKEFLSTYGSGAVDNFLWVFNPASSNPYLNLIEQKETVLNALEETSSKFPDLFTMPLFPAADGFLPFAGTDNGDNIFWVVHGDNPNSWTIAVMGPRSPKVFYYKSGFRDFLITVLRSEIRCTVFPSSFPKALPTFFMPSRG